MTSRSLRLAVVKVAPVVFLGVLPVVVLILGSTALARHGEFGVDFRHELYPEAKLLVHGENPFPPPDADLSAGTNRIFPVPAAALVAPFTLLPVAWAVGSFLILLVAALAATLRILDVRDWRVYGVVALWPSSLAAVQSGNLSILLALLLALAWRYRDRPWAPGIAIGAAIALKLFLWPTLGWLLALRRYRAVALGVAIGAVGGFLLVLPFTSIRDFLELMNNLSRVFGPRSYNLVGLTARSHVASAHVGQLLALGAGLALLVPAYLRRSLPLALAAALAASPIVWNHYFVLLAVPLAVGSKRLAPAWFVPLAMWVCPGTADDIRLWQIVVGLSVLAAVTVLVEWPRDRSGGLRRAATNDDHLRVTVEHSAAG